MKYKKQIKKILIVFFILIAFVLIFNNINLEKNGIKTIKYRIYTKEDGWSKWIKNGKEAGNKENNILKVEIKTKADNNINIGYFNGKNWNYKSDNKRVTAISFSNMYKFVEKYSMCYRTYNKKNKWLNWTCSDNVDNISGNKDEEITSIQIKIIPKNVVLNDYLKDYKTNKNNSNLGFD